MSTDNNKLSTNFLDHEAIRVKDINVSAAWYQKVLGLKKQTTPEWGTFSMIRKEVICKALKQLSGDKYATIL